MSLAQRQLTEASARVRPALRADWQRLRDSVPAIVQIVVASSVAFALAQALLHQSNPLIAALIPISSLGFVGDARPIRVLETAIAMTLGIALAESLLLGLGSSVWSFALALAVTLTLARFVSAKAAFAISAAVQCTLVMLNPAPPGGPFIRSVDALIGGAVALLATALLPRNPFGAAVRSGQRLLREHITVHSLLADALHSADRTLADAALARARETQSKIDNWAEAVDSGRAIAQLSPFYWRRRGELDRLAEMVPPLDLATRNLRVFARRVEFLVGLGQSESSIARLCEQFGRVCDLILASITAIEWQAAARHELIEMAKHLDAETILGRPASGHELNTIHAARPYVIDLLVTTGMPLEAARSALVELD